MTLKGKEGKEGREGMRGKQRELGFSRFLLLPPTSLFFLLFLLAGCGDTGIDHGMERQPKNNPLTESHFFPDKRSARPLVPGTIPRGHLKDDPLLYTGKVNGKPSEIYPFPITKAILERGRERYDIYCSVCHDRVGTGRGMIVRRGFQQPPSFHSERLRKAAPGHYFDVITNGYGAMYPYNDRVSVPDRWAIAAYIKALQLSQDARPQDVPEAYRQTLDREPATAASTAKERAE
jgi:hypothetical protein